MGIKRDKPPKYRVVLYDANTDGSHFSLFPDDTFDNPFDAYDFGVSKKFLRDDFVEVIVVFEKES